MPSSPQFPARMHHRMARLSVIGVAAGSLLAGMTVLAGVGLTASGAATNLYVSSTGDNSNNCSKAAPCLTIQHAINVASSGAVINLSGNTFRENIDVTKNLTIAGTTSGGSLDVTTSTINGVGGLEFVVTVEPGKIVTLSNLVVTGINTAGGGIANDGDLTLNNVNVQDNVGFGEGSGISNEGDLIMNGGVVSGNQATDNTNGGGLDNVGDAILNGVTFTHDSAERSGGAIFNNGELKLTGLSALHNNSAGNEGGGIFECNGEPLSIGPKVSITANTPDNIFHLTCV